MSEISPFAAEPPRSAAPPARDDRSLQEQLGLSGTEIEILMRLVAWGRLARERICGITVSGHRTIKPSSINPIMAGLRKKLIAHRVKLVTIHGFGFGLSQEDRGRIVELIKPRKTPPGVAAEGLHSPYGDHGCKKTDGGVE
jgi:hypothetical protein